MSFSVLIFVQSYYFNSFFVIVVGEIQLAKTEKYAFINYCDFE